MALQTVESEDLQRIILRPDITTSNMTEGTVPQEWQDLDLLLVRFWTSRSIRPQVVYAPITGGEDTSYHAPNLLPELTRRGAVDLVGTYPSRTHRNHSGVHAWPLSL